MLSTDAREADALAQCAYVPHVAVGQTATFLMILPRLRCDTGATLRGQGWVPLVMADGGRGGRGGGAQTWKESSPQPSRGRGRGREGWG